MTQTSGVELHHRSRADSASGDVPIWFRKLLPISLQPAVSDVTHGWKRLGTVSVVSHSDYAHQDLWDLVWAECVLSAWILLASLLILQVILSWLFKPLVRVEKQATAIANRQWKIEKYIPKTKELRRVVLAMNNMVEKLQTIFEEQASLTEQLRRDSFHDQGSGLLNRRGFDQRLQHVLGDEEGHSGLLMILQLHNFADFNLNEGRQAGDDVMAQLGKVMSQWQTENSNSFVGRRSGADVAMYIPCTGLDQADDLLQQTFSQLSVSTLSSRQKITFHIGGVFLTGAVYDPVQALSQADAALRQAQRQPVSRCRLYDETPSTNEWTATQWQELLRQVLNDDLVQLRYLPVVSSRGGEVIQYEVFSRIIWEEQELAAARFWPMVEQHQLTAEFDQLVIEDVLTDMSTVAFHNAARVCVNLSPASVMDENFQHQLVNLLRQYPQQAKQLAIELPEFCLSSVEHALTRLSTLLEPLGVVIGVDQVGTGNTAFAYLQRLPLEYVRIDGSFNRGISQLPDHRFFLQSMVQIAHNLDLAVLGEGLETFEDIDTVRKVGVDGLSGYYFTKPMISLTEAVEWSPE